MITLNQKSMSKSTHLFSVLKVVAISSLLMVISKEIRSQNLLNEINFSTIHQFSACKLQFKDKGKCNWYTKQFLYGAKVVNSEQRLLSGAGEIACHGARPLQSYAQDVESAFNHAEVQAEEMLRQVRLSKAKKAENEKKLPLVTPRTLEDGALILVPSRDWTSGFFPGELWYLYEFTKNTKWLSAAKEFTADIEKEKLNATTHDMGFKIFSSFGNGYRLTKGQAYKDVIIQAAKTLSTRFNPKVGAIRSWDHNSDKWNYPVIIDNMMNLELLFEATKITEDSSFHKIAVAHANTTLKNHFRPDYSSYHVISYNPQTGVVEKKNTHQGFSDESAWARGQAWALYGYTMCYRYTKNTAYLEQAQNIANFIFTNKNLPNDLVPYWDFNAPGIPNEPRDCSAAAVIASALYELSNYSDDGKTYIKKANRILRELSKKYTSEIRENKGFILLHSTGSKPRDKEIDVPLIYADYYYLEALLRKKNIVTSVTR